MSDPYMHCEEKTKAYKKMSEDHIAVRIRGGSSDEIRSDSAGY